MDPRRRRVEWTDRARRALDAAIAFIAADSPAAAERVLIEILEAAGTLDVMGERGRPVAELDDPGVRELILPPYRLIYEVEASRVRILTIIHHARELRGRGDRSG